MHQGWARTWPVPLVVAWGGAGAALTAGAYLAVWSLLYPHSSGPAVLGGTALLGLLTGTAVALLGYLRPAIAMR